MEHGGLQYSNPGHLLLLPMFQKLCYATCVHSTSVFGMQMIDFGLADFREVFGAGYVTGKHRSLIHNEPHHVQPLRQQNSKGSSNKQNTGKEEPEHRHLSGLRGNKGISKRSDAVPKGLRVSKFFPTPAGLLPQVSFCIMCAPPRLRPPPPPLPPQTGPNTHFLCKEVVSCMPASDAYVSSGQAFSSVSVVWLL